RVGSSPRKPRLQRTRLPCAPRLWVLTYGKLVGPSRDRVGQVVGMPPEGVSPPKSGGKHSSTPAPSPVCALSIAALPSRLGRALSRSDQAPPLRDCGGRRGSAGQGAPRVRLEPVNPRRARRFRTVAPSPRLPADQSKLRREGQDRERRCPALRDGPKAANVDPLAYRALTAGISEVAENRLSAGAPEEVRTPDPQIRSLVVSFAGSALERAE